MAGNMEDILMGGGSDSDDSDDNNKLIAPGPSVGRTPPLNPAANTAPLSTSVPPPNVARSSSKSELTNRLKNLYASPSNAAVSGGSSAPIASGNLPRGGIQVPHLPSQPQPSAPSPSGSYGPSSHSMPPPAPQQQQQPPPGYNHSHHPSANAAHRMPAPLPKARTNNRSAPPANRMASVPSNSSAGMPPPSSQAQYPQQPHHLQQQPPPGSYHPTASRPTASNYPPHHHPGANSGPPSRSSSSRGLPQQQQPPQMQTQQSGSAPQQQVPTRSSLPMSKVQQAQLQQQQMKQQLQIASSHPAASSRSASLNSVDVKRTNMTDAEKKQKENFLLFTRVLMKYLEQHDKEMHQKAKVQLKECYDRNKAGDPMFRSLTDSMTARLRATVGEVYWKRAVDYLDHFFKKKKLKPIERDGQQPPDPSASGGAVPTQQQPVPAISSNAPSGRAVTTVQPRPHHQMTQAQAQAAVAMKMPIQGGTRPLSTGSNIPTSSVSTAVVPPTTSTSVPTPTAVETSSKKKKDEEERRVERNAANRARRAYLKKKKEEEQQKLIMSKLESGSANVSAPSLIAPADPLAPVGLLSSTPIATTTPSTIGGSSVSTTASTSSKKVKDLTKAKKIVKKPSQTSINTIKKKATPLVKEYEDHMEWLDHAVMIDVKSLPNLFSKECMTDVNLHEEQRNLLYGDKSHRDKVKEITDAATRVLSSDSDVLKLKEAGVPPLPWNLPSRCNGWGEKNVVSTRTAWARVRLPESESQTKERKKDLEENSRRMLPMCAPSSSVGVNRRFMYVPLTTGSLATQGSPLPSSAAAEDKSDHEQSSLLTIEDDTTNHVWFNEARASQDPTLALLSEATELYLKSAIENAIDKARLRQNLDGVRLWSTLLTQSSESKNENITARTSAVIRLGCDVRRQVALAEGNAAKTYQRMEEAISRQNGMYHSNLTGLEPDTMILESTSVGDLSKKPPLKSAVENADIHAKRKFEIFGGKHSREPPLGRVLKQAKVTLQDISVGSLGNKASTNRACRMAMMASLFS